MQVHVVHRTAIEGEGAAAVDAGEVMLIPFGGGIEGFAAGQVATAQQAPLLQLAQVAIDGGQPHRQRALAQLGMNLLAGEFRLGLAQLLQQPLLLLRKRWSSERWGHGAAKTIRRSYGGPGLVYMECFWQAGAGKRWAGTSSLPPGPFSRGC